MRALFTSSLVFHSQQFFCSLTITRLRSNPPQHQNTHTFTHTPGVCVASIICFIQHTLFTVCFSCFDKVTGFCFFLCVLCHQKNHKSPLLFYQKNSAAGNETKQHHNTISDCTPTIESALEAWDRNTPLSFPTADIASQNINIKTVNNDDETRQPTFFPLSQYQGRRAEDRRSGKKISIRALRMKWEGRER